MNPVFDEPPNPTNVEETLQRIKSNESSLTEVNLNNIKVNKKKQIQTHRGTTRTLYTTAGEVDMLLLLLRKSELIAPPHPPEHSDSHIKGHCKGHGEEHSRQKVQHGSDAE